jgi:(2R)-ethylmalonyl-CoA mutase
LRLQQILAFETDLLEYEDIFDGSGVISRKEQELEEEADAEMKKIMEMGGVIVALENGYMKRSLVESNAKRLREIESGDRVVVGINQFETGEPSALLDGMSESFLTVDESVEEEQISSLREFRKRRNSDDVARAIDLLKQSASEGKNIMDASMACAEAGVTTGEWGDALRSLFGEYRAPTGISGIAVGETAREEVLKVNDKIKRLNEKLGRTLKILIGKPGLDGHSNGAEQVAVKAKDVGMDVVYEGIRLTPEQIAESAMQEGVHVVGISLLSGSHLQLVPEVVRCMKERGLGDTPVILGGIIPEEDVGKMQIENIKKVYAPKDFNLNRIMSEIADVVAEANSVSLS